MQSPRRRSILKGSHTPLRYNSPLFQHEQVKRRERLEEKKKVSFAPDTQLREDSPPIPNIIEETEPAGMSSDLFTSPLNSTRIRGSPLDQHRRDRQPDLFGSPPTNKSLHQRSGGHPPSLLNKVYHEEQPDLTHFLHPHQKSPHNLFEDGSSDEEERVEGSSSRKKQRLDEDVTMEITQVIGPLEKKKEQQEEEEDDAMQITQEIAYPMEFSPLRPIAYHSPIRPSPSPVAYSPLRPQSNMLVASPATAKSTQSRMSSAYSPAKSFYLHDRSPLSTHSRRSMSMGSDHVFSYDQTNLLEEEFSGLYDSTIEEGDLDPNITLTDFLRYVGIEFPNPTPKPFKPTFHEASSKLGL
ncbi:hypothetical protein A0J61_09761 [Choanephora cucurbitarum]|uniref:Uncharacterized protein n=1 Tax=Choanephora cucurbitarum TaxID=101091 RepID=A0A1C7MZC9_9FUNG|nr:hypothetical protein A0J61_09761 [Choanephora cucurbitarum]